MNKSLWLKVLFPFLAHLPLFTFFANNPFFKCPKSPHTTFRTIPLIDWKYLPDCWISVSSRHCWRWRRDANVLVHHLCLLQGLSSKGAHLRLSPASRRWTSMSYLLPPLTGSAEMIWYFILVNNVVIPWWRKHNSQDREGICGRHRHKSNECMPWYGNDYKVPIIDAVIHFWSHVYEIAFSFLLCGWKDRGPERAHSSITARHGRTMAGGDMMFTRVAICPLSPGKMKSRV